MTEVVDLAEARRRRQEARDEAWTCSCGSQNFTIQRVGPVCYACGQWTPWSDFLIRTGIDVGDPPG